MMSVNSNAETLAPSSSQPVSVITGQGPPKALEAGTGQVSAAPVTSPAAESASQDADSELARLEARLAARKREAAAQQEADLRARTEAEARLIALRGVPYENAVQETHGGTPTRTAADVDPVPSPAALQAAAIPLPMSPDPHRPPLATTGSAPAAGGKDSLTDRISSFMSRITTPGRSGSPSATQNRKNSVGGSEGLRRGSATSVGSTKANVVDGNAVSAPGLKNGTGTESVGGPSPLSSYDEL
jgi:hypothetical protein